MAQDDVVLVTQRASVDDLAESDYRDIYADLRDRRTLDQFCALTGSAYSKGTWSKYEAGTWALTRQAKNELRRAVGLGELPVTVAEATAVVDPDASVWRVGPQLPSQVILVGAERPITLHVALDVQVVQKNATARRVRGRGQIEVSRAFFEALNRARGGRKWEDFLKPLVEEEEPHA